DELRRDLLPARNKFDSIGLNCKLYDFALGSDFGSAIRSRRNEQKVEFVAHSHRDYGIASNDGEMKFCIKKIQFGGEALSFDGFVDIDRKKKRGSTDYAAAAGFIARQSGLFNNDDFHIALRERERGGSPCRAAPDYGYFI